MNKIDYQINSFAYENQKLRESDRKIEPNFDGENATNQLMALNWNEPISIDTFA